MSAAYPCQYKKDGSKICGLAPNNGVHLYSRRYFNFHDYVPPDPVPYVPSLEERITELERRVDELEGLNKAPQERQL